MSLLDDLYAMVILHPDITNNDWPLHLGILPDNKDQGIALFETGGFPADTYQRENDRPTFQMRIRGQMYEYQSTRAKWQQLYNLFQDSRPTADYAYVQAMMTSPMTFWDEKGRPNFTTNWRVFKKRTTS